jgi:hypothetical protein
LKEGLGRPCLISIFNEGIIHINVHMPHSPLTDELNKIKNALRNYDLSKYRVIFCGDFNHDTPETISEFNKITTFNKEPYKLNTCCLPPSNYYPNTYDHIYDNMTPATVYKTLDKADSHQFYKSGRPYMSDHLPVFAVFPAIQPVINPVIKPVINPVIQPAIQPIDDSVVVNMATKIVAKINSIDKLSDVSKKELVALVSNLTNMECIKCLYTESIVGDVEIILLMHNSGMISLENYNKYNQERTQIKYYFEKYISYKHKYLKLKQLIKNNLLSI